MGLAIWLLEAWLRQAGDGSRFRQMFWRRFFCFLPRPALLSSAAGWQSFRFLQQGVVQQFGWLNEHQFLDAVAVAMITPGPVVITVAFIGFLVAGLAGSIMASIGIFLPVYFFTIIPSTVVQTPPRQPSAQGLR